MKSGYNAIVGIRKIKELKPNKWNPNELPQDKLQHLKQEIARVGYLQPILINKDNVIIDGYHRYQVLKETKGEDAEIQVVIVDMPEREAKVQSINMNLIRGFLNPQKLGNLLTDLEKEYETAKLSQLTNISEREINLLKNVKEQQKEDALMLLHSPVGRETYARILESEESVEELESPDIQGTTTGVRIPIIFFLEDADLADKIKEIFSTDEFDWSIRSELNTNKFIHLLKQAKLL